MSAKCKHCGTSYAAPRVAVAGTFWGRCGACHAPFFNWAKGEREAFIADWTADAMAADVLQELGMEVPG